MRKVLKLDSDNIIINIKNVQKMMSISIQNTS